MKKTSMMKMISIARKEGQPQTGSTLIDTTTSSSRLATWARLQRLSICGCLMLALICLNLPNVGMGATNLNYMPANAAAQFAATRRLASVGPTLNQAESFLPAGDPRAHYQLLDTSGDGILDPDEAALLMAGDLFNTFQAKQDQEVLPTIKQQQQQHATGDSRHHTSSSQLGSSQSSLPGHYEFEVAPKMEPPGAPKPPFKQANSACPGSDIFGGFSPRHTLCGDLYQGKVPLNPMGQFVNDQAYPFELIKNKTLQFLARSLPILKGEYETIPKVARYLPANQLLNPTSYQSPLGHEHFHALNQLEQQQAAGSQLLAAMSQPEAPPFLRKKRSLGPAGTSTSSGRQQHQQQQASITVAELMPNATLVVSSAHSSAGRIGGSGSGAGHYNHGARSADALPGKHFTMITKDGQRSIGTNNNNDSGSGATNSPNRATRVQNDEQHISQGQTGGGGNRLASQQQQQQGQGQINAGSQHQAIAKSHAANQIVGPSGQLQQQTDTISSREHHQHHAMSPQQTIESKATNSDAAHSNNSNNQRHYQQQQQQQHLQARSVPQSIVIDVASGRQQAGQPQDSQVVSAAAGNDGQIQTASSHRSGFGGGFSSGAARAASKQSAGSGGSPLKCANVNGLLMYTVCQAASALIEPADSTPTWLQAAKQIGTLYAAASNTDSYSAGPTAASPLWALWSALAPGPSSSDKSSSSSSPSATDSSSSSSSEQTSQDIAYKSSNGNHHTKGSSQTPISSVAGVISLLNPLMSFFGPSLQRTGDAGQLQQQSGSSSKTGNKTHNHHHSTTNTGLTSNLKTLSNLLLTGLSIAGLYDWLGTSGIFSPTATTFARRKKPYEAGETFVDTPASLAAMASAKQLSPGATVGAGGAPIKQPPTPCPSVEEYISPTFARNYQGAWKYVVQIPHEGYFTQTIQRSSCMRQKCEFTEGVCHEAPRWVSLLVAEIYYPKAIFGMAQTGGAPAGQPAGLVGQVAASDRLALDPGFSGQSSASMINQLMTASPSTSQLQQVALGSGSGNMVGVSPMPMNANHHLNNQQQQQQLLQHQAKSMNGAHQDPLQMTDSLNNYNHNLNSAFINAATELGLDPTNMAQMQQLANAHNYQFLQRNGFVHTNNQQQQQQYHQQQQQVAAAANQAPAAEPRSSSPNTNQITRQQQQQQYGTNPMRSSPQQQQFVDPMQGQQQQQVFSNDYIKALAIETIRQHPHLSIDDLIKSLQMKQIRKRRDLATAASSTSQQLSSALHQQQQQALSSMAPLQHHQQQQQQHYSQKLDSLVQQANQNQIARSSVPPPQQNPSLSAESSPSINELGMEAAHLPQQQQQQHPQQYQQQAMSTQSRSNQLDQQQQTSQMLASQAQASLAHDITSTGTNQQHSQQANNNNPHQHHHHHHTFQADQQTPPIDPSSNAAATSGLGQTSAASSPQAAADSQTECDGHDKIGCYVVRVYYDWFLVNGSCKCWKTNTPDQQQHSGQSSSSSAGGGSSSGSAGFIRRIFTG